MSQPRRLLGRCPVLFLLAVCFDVLGLSLILTGIFATVQLDGRSFGDFIIYGGGILLFFSLLLWLGWYSFNLEVSMEELVRDIPAPPKRGNLVQLARKFSERFSKRERRKGATKGSSAPHSLPKQPLPLTPSVFISNLGLSSPLQPPGFPQTPWELSSVSSLFGHMETVGVQVVVDRLV
ncbi:transmembrane protein 238-like [Pseudophryne corroboree]|uniref:transmembrane protein 238-like n=1 Tax=Pseudophryne corroboree TaxID=495146 RepID=UPI003082097C